MPRVWVSRPYWLVDVMKWTLAWEMILIATLATVFVRNVGNPPKVEIHLPFVIHPGTPAVQVKPETKDEKPR